MLNLIVIRTNQLKTLMEFYQCFELKFDYHQHGKGVMHYSCEMNNGIVFEIYPFLKNQITVDVSTRLGFNVQSLASTIQQLEKLNAIIVQAPKMTKWGKRAIVKDLDGRKVELIQLP
jgi:hypothetical protein